jgi:branched-chain amino acid transport system substrate-binding protein
VRAEAKMVWLSQGTQLEYFEGTGEASEGVLMHTSWHPSAPFEGELGGEPFTNADFVRIFGERNGGTVPDEDVAIPFAVCQAIAQAMEGAGSAENAAVGEWLAARTEAEPVRTILGRFAWDERGLPVGKPFLMAQWQGGDLKFVYPTDEFDAADMTYPKGGF